MADKEKNNSPKNDIRWYMQPGVITLIVSVIVIGLCAMGILVYLGI